MAANTAAGGGVHHKLCPLCSFRAPTVPAILSHLRIIHSSDPNFIVPCGLDGCATTARSFSALYSHIYRRHPSFIRKRAHSDMVQGQDEIDYSSTQSSSELTAPEPIATVRTDESADIQHLMGIDTKRVQRSSALFLLKLKELSRVSQVAIDDIVSGTRELFFQSIQHMQAAVRSKLAESGVDPSSIKGLDSVFMTTPLFSGLETNHYQEKFWREKLNLIDPIEVKIGESQYMPQFSGSKRKLTKKWDTYQYIPLLHSLRQLLADASVLEQIDQLGTRIHSDGLIEDFCDAKRFKNHPLFSQDTSALQIVLFYDEVEICNPLGSHVKQHKLGIVFYTLGNIAPKYRSQLKAINLAIVATAPIIDVYGLDKVLQPLVKDLNILASTGISISVDGCTREFKGALVTCLADNLASNQVGGFKQSFSFAFRSCRTCMVTSDSLCNSFVSEGYEKRTQSEHLRHLEEIQGPTAAHFSKVYGINSRSALLDIRDYDIFNGGLAHDVMHDIFEGAAPLEVKLLLSYCINKHWFTLNNYNDRLLNFNFGYSENDKPIAILSQALQPDKSLRSSASQMALLLRILPFIIGDKVPEGDLNWKCFLLLRKIVEIVLAPVVSDNMCSSLKLLIREHHLLFVTLYGKEAYIPKLHFMTHYPEQIELLGPMVRANTIRHEAKLNFFKQVSSLVNFKNVALSMADRHQRWMCYQLASGSLLRSPLECGPPTTGTGISLLKYETKNVQDNLLLAIPHVSLDSQLFRPKWVKQSGIHYENNNAYIITGYDGLDPIFSKLDELIIIGGDLVVFVTSLCEVSYFDSHYHAYIISVLPQKAMFCKLLDHHVYHGHKLHDGQTCITLRYMIL